MKSHVLAGLALVGALVFIAAPPTIFADDHDKKTDVTISEPVEVPGGVVLQPGTYMFRLMDITGNRHVVQIRSEDGKKTYAIAMTAAAYRVQPTSKVELTFFEMPSGQPPVVHKWFWPGDVDGQEFLYPHKRAAEITRLSKETVKEASEEDQNAANTAAATDNTSAPDNSVAVATATTDNTQVADNSAAVAVAPAPEPAPAAVSVTETTPAAPAPSDQAQLLAQANPPAPSSTPAPQTTTDSLPQTASDFPLIALIGGLSLAAAVTMRSLRRA